MFSAAKYRIYPTADQEILLSKHFGCVRWVYNSSLEKKIKAWEENKESLSRFDLQRIVVSLKRQTATSWLKEVNSQSLQAALVNLDMAYTRFFRSKSGFPKFKSKNSEQSFQVPQFGSVGENFIKILKVGKLRASISLHPEGRVKTITISKTTTGKYFASVLCETDEPTPEKLPVTEAGTLGIDLGLKHFAVLSTGEKIENPRHFKKGLRKLRRASRRHSKKAKCGKNRDKSRKRLALVHEKISNQRKDFLQKLTSRLVNDNQVDSFAIEDLAVSNMVKNHHLARAISDAGWGEFRRQLEYKAERKGKNILVIGRFEPSSKACPCGQVSRELKLSDRIWTCSCGLEHDRDINAARNIKRFALHPQNFIGRDTPEYTLEEIGQ